MNKATKENNEIIKSDTPSSITVMVNEILDWEKDIVYFQGILMEPSSKRQFCETKRKVILSGQIAGIELGAIYAVEAQAVPDRRYDRRHDILNAELLESAARFALRLFLLRCEAMTPKRVDLLLDKYGLEVIKEIADNAHTLDFLALKPKAQGKIQSFANDRILFHTVLHLMVEHKLDCRLADRIYDLYHKLPVKTVMSSIYDNPYMLFLDALCTFNQADALYLRTDNPADSDMRCRYAVLGALYAAEKNGDICIPRKDVRGKVWELLKQTEGASESQTRPFSPEAVSQAIEVLKKREMVIWDTVGSKSGVYLRESCISERTVVKYLQDALSGFKYLYFFPEQVEEFLEQYGSDSGFALDPTQKEAVRKALLHPVSIITGGPGTGKTQTLRAICEIVRSMYPDAEIRGCAPTGKAAIRMKEASGIAAQTIHRLLGLGSSKPLGCQELECDFVIVDEATMMDTQLAAKLLYALHPQVRLILVGDVDQLPSVGPGRVFADLIESEVIPVTELTHIHRQSNDSNTVSNLKAITNQQPGQDIVLHQSTGAGGDFYFFHREDAMESLEDLIQSRRQLLDGGLPLESVMVLTPVHDGELGEANLNVVLQDVFNPRAGNYVQAGGQEFRLGDPVRQTRNNYELEVMNGETGILQEFLEDSVIVRYPGDRLVKYTPEDMIELDLAYAITIHQAQGSEWPAVLIPVIKTTSKNLLYTAISRGKELVILTGRTSALASGLRREIKRYTLLTERIRLAVEQQAGESAQTRPQAFSLPETLAS